MGFVSTVLATLVRLGGFFVTDITYNALDGALIF